MPLEKVLLLVDDEEDWCKLIARRFRSKGWRVIVAADGDSALELYEENQKELSVVVSDLKMPGMQGEDLLPAIRARNEDLPLIAITGEPDRKAHLEALTTGAYFYLEKPFKPDVLLRYLDNAHHLYELRVDLLKAREQELEASRLFRKFIISDSPHDVVTSRRLQLGGIGLEIASHGFEASRPGGDYVEWFSRGSEEVVFCVGDAAGHGEFTCTLMACLSTIVLHRSNHMGRLGLEEMATLIDESLLELKDRKGIEGNRFMCLFLGSISLLSGRMEYINAGHTDGFLVSGNGAGSLSTSRLPPHSPAPGLVSRDLRKQRPLLKQGLKVDPGDLLVVFTDGVSEALAEDDPVKGMARLQDAVEELGDPSSASETLARLVAWISEEAGEGGLEDDATLMVLRVLSGQEAQGLSRAAPTTAP